MQNKDIRWKQRFQNFEKAFLQPLKELYHFFYQETQN
jgi:hypothetical protein